jgi:hypothetical protein
MIIGNVILCEILLEGVRALHEYFGFLRESLSILYVTLVPSLKENPILARIRNRRTASRV